MEVRTCADLQALIKRRRLERGLTQAELAQAAGVSRRWVNLERGRGEFSVRSDLELAHRRHRGARQELCVASGWTTGRACSLL
jgi:transcriptional regulator with XRE-family HTH domain